MAPKETPGASAPGTRLKTRKIVSGPLLHFRFHTYLETFSQWALTSSGREHSKKFATSAQRGVTNNKAFGRGAFGVVLVPQHLYSHLLRIIHTRAQLGKAVLASRTQDPRTATSTAHAHRPVQRLKTQQRRRTGPRVEKSCLGISILHPSSNLDAIWISAATLARTPLTPHGDAIGEAGAIGEATMHQWRLKSRKIESGPYANFHFHALL